MIWIGLVDTQKFHFTARVGHIGIAGDLEACDDRITIFIGVVDEEPSILRNIADERPGPAIPVHFHHFRHDR